MTSPLELYNDITPVSNECSDKNDYDTDDNDDEFDFITSQWENGVETGLTISWPGSHRPLQLSTKLTEDRIAPLFDGTQWAGTRVWKAAVVALEYILSLNNLPHDQDPNGNGNGPQQQLQQQPSSTRRYQSLLELGCGLGVPAMVWHLLQQESSTTATDYNNKNKQDDSTSCSIDSDSVSPSPRVVLTDMPDLLPQLEANVRHNFPDSYGTIIQAKPLDWSKEELQALWKQQEQMTQSSNPNHNHHDDDDDSRGRPVFDICLNCDCIYEPLYGRKAWEALADVLAEVARLSPSTLIVTSVERRTADGVEDFCHRLLHSGTIQSIQQVLRNDEDPHHIIEVYVTKGIEPRTTH